MNKTYSKTLILVEGALMVALSTVLSMIKIFEMPLGGSVTLFSMLPIVIMSFRNGPKWGLFTGFVYSILQLILGIQNLGYCATLGAQIGCILLDYVFAFTLLGAACVFALPFKKKLAGVAFGTVVVCLIRFLCSFLSGILLWGSYQSYYEWAANLPLWLYSLIYNGNYMLPETILTTVGALLIFRYLPRLFDRQ